MIPKKDDNRIFRKDRRKYHRIEKNFILTYFFVGSAEHKYEITQLKNISKGGMCFITSYAIPGGTPLKIELRTPYLSESTHLEGTVIESHEKIANILYETRLEFGELNQKAMYLLDKLVEFFVNGEL